MEWSDESLPPSHRRLVAVRACQPSQDQLGIQGMGNPETLIPPKQLCKKVGGNMLRLIAKGTC